MFKQRWGSHRLFCPIVGGILALLVYLAIAWFVLPPGVFCTPDEGGKLLQLQNLRFENGLAYDIPYYGHELDPELQFAPQDSSWGLYVRDDALFFQRLPVFPSLVLPFFRWFDYHGLYLLPALGGAVSSVLALHLLERRDRRLGMWLLIAFGSPVFIYAMIFWEHTLATGLGIAGAWLALLIGSRKGLSPFRRMLGWSAVGVVLGLSIFMRLEMTIFALALLSAHWFIVRDNRWGPLWALATLGLMMLLYLLLHVTISGQMFPDNARYLVYPLHYLKRAEWRAVPDLLIGPLEEGALDTGWLGGLWAIAAVVVVAHSFNAIESPATRTLRLVGLVLTVIIGAVFLFTPTFYYSAHGILFTTPWVLLGLTRAREVWKRGGWRAQIIVLTAILGLIGYTVGIIGLRASSPHGGLEWGARFAMVFYPLLALVAAWDLGEKRRDVKTLAVVGALVFLGLGFQVRGVWAFRDSKQINAELNQIILEMPEQHVVFDRWWMPLNAAPVYSQKEFFVADTSEKLEDWLALADAHQIRRFSLVTPDAAFLGNTTQALNEHSLSAIEIHQLSGLLIYQLRIERK